MKKLFTAAITICIATFLNAQVLEENLLPKDAENILKDSVC